MRDEIFFLNSIEDPTFSATLDNKESQALTQYLDEVEQGPANGSMDIDWQMLGRGYYQHLQVLDVLQQTDQLGYQEYLQKLLSDIEAWKQRCTPLPYTVKRVEEELLRLGLKTDQ